MFKFFCELFFSFLILPLGKHFLNLRVCFTSLGTWNAYFNQVSLDVNKKIRLNSSCPYLCTLVLWLKHKEKPEDKKKWRCRKHSSKRQTRKQQLKGPDPATPACLGLFQNVNAIQE